MQVPAMGELCADLMVGQKLALDIGNLRPEQRAVI